MWTIEDEALLAQPLPALQSVAVTLPIYAGGAGVVEYREAGPPDRPAILLMHGGGSSSAGYRAQLAGLRDRYRLIAWNAPGFGRSTPLTEPRPDTSAYVAAAIAMLKALGVTELAALVGSSWGSVVAMALAQSSGFPVRSLVLAAPNTARGQHDSPQQREEALQSALAMVRAGFHQDRSDVAARLLAPGAPAIVRELTMRLRDASTLQGFEQAISMLFTIHTPQVLPQVAAKVTIVVGSEDKIAPESAHAAVLHAARPDATCVRIDGIGHLPKLEAPAAFNRLIDASVVSA